MPTTLSSPSPLQWILHRKTEEEIGITHQIWPIGLNLTNHIDNQPCFKEQTENEETKPKIDYI